MAIRIMSRVNYVTLWLASITVVALSFWTQEALAACQPCDVADSILVPCNSPLNMNNWPGTFMFQPVEAQSKCVCNQNFYDQVSACLTCQSSTTAHFTVMALPQYQAICLTFGQQWQQIYNPHQTTSSSAAPSGTVQPSNVADPGNIGSTHNNSLSSGAIAGIVVSGIALLVALSVAGYVYTRRQRDQRKQQEDDDLYKFQETNRGSYMETQLPQYTGMIQPSLPSLPQLTNLRVMNPDSDDEDMPRGPQGGRFDEHKANSSFEVGRTSSPGWRRGSFDDD